MLTVAVGADFGSGRALRLAAAGLGLLAFAAGPGTSAASAQCASMFTLQGTTCTLEVQSSPAAPISLAMPGGVTLQMELFGAGGGGAGLDETGVGGAVIGDLAITSAETLTLDVGQMGGAPGDDGTGGPGGWGGGGNGGAGVGGGYGGGGGGGGTYVFGPTGTLLLAAGGGGGIASLNSGGAEAEGGNGGQLGTDPPDDVPTAGESGGGTTPNGGAGAGYASSPGGGAAGSAGATAGMGPAAAEAFGDGGAGGSGTAAEGGGGGGGGYYGGGGGGGSGGSGPSFVDGGGGGGGSGYASPQVPARDVGTGSFSADGIAILTYEEPTSNYVSIASDGAIAEPASGSTPATFTITLPAAQSADTTVDYETVDGTATVTADNYTAVNSSVMILAGQTSAQVTVPIDSGSGVSTTASIAFQVQLTSVSGGDGALQIDPSNNSTSGVIEIPGIGGRLTATGSSPAGGVTVTLTGTAGTGQTVSQTTTTNPSGVYQFYADPGTYTVTPAPPPKAAGNPGWFPQSCPGSAVAGACKSIALGPGANLTLNFSEVDEIVNSTELDTDSALAALGICDVTPSQATPTCTLPQAIMVSNDSGGETIGFDIPGGGVPVIELDSTQPPPAGSDGNVADSLPASPDPSADGGLPALSATATIDGTTQPGSGRVEILDAPENADASGMTYAPGLTVGAGANGSVIKGLDIAGFPQQLAVEAPSVTVQNDYLGMGPSGLAPGGAPPRYMGATRVGLWVGSTHDQIGGTASGAGNLISGNDTCGATVPWIGYGIYIGPGGGGAVIQGNTLGPPLGGSALAATQQVVSGSDACTAGQVQAVSDTVGSGADTLGGAAAAAGNVIAGTSLLDPAGEVVQGNTIDGGTVQVGDNATIGGSTPTPGAAPGNTLSRAGISLGNSDAAQGNLLTDGQILVGGDHNTIGGDKPDLGNKIDGFAPDPGAYAMSVDLAAISIGQRGDPSRAGGDGNVVKNNRLSDDQNDGAVAVYGGTGNEIVANAMTTDSFGILLGGQPYRYNHLGGSGQGPNKLQPYPNLITAIAGRTLDVTAAFDGLPVFDSLKTLRVDVYAQAGCAEDSLTPGEGAVDLGQADVKTGVSGSVTFKLLVPNAPAGDRALSLTATAADGSTSEFSPCLMIGASAPQFAKSGVTVPDQTIPVSPASGNAADDSARTARLEASVHRPALDATLRPFCPPVTAGSCKGTITLTVGRGRHRTRILRRAFTLAPGELGRLRFKLPSAVAKKLRKGHGTPVAAMIVAHDRHHHRVTTNRTLSLRRSVA